MDRGAGRATVHGVANNWTRLKQLSALLASRLSVFVAILIGRRFQNNSFLEMQLVHLSLPDLNASAPVL